MSEDIIRARTKERWRKLDSTSRDIQYFVARKLLILDEDDPVDAEITRVQYNSAKIDSTQEKSDPNGRDILITYMGKTYKSSGLAGIFEKEAYTSGPYTRYFSLDEFIEEIDAYEPSVDEPRVSRAAFDLKQSR